MAKPPDADIPNNDRSVWRGLVVEPEEFTPPKSNSKWLIGVVLLGLAGAGLGVWTVLGH